MNKKVYFHVGMAKTATSFLQKYIFLKSSFCYLGKDSKSHSQRVSEDDPWLYMKFLQREAPGISSSVLKRKQEKIPVLFDKYNHYLEIISKHSGFLISDESLTASPLIHHLNLLYPFMLELVASSIVGWKNYFEAGVGLADHAWSGSGKNMAYLRANLLKGKNSHFLSFKLLRIMEMFDLRLGRILLVDRDIGSWFVSFFLKVSAECKNNRLVFGLPLLFVWAGFCAKWDKYLREVKSCGYLHGSSFALALSHSFGEGVLDIVQYDKNSSVFAERISSILPFYGVCSSEAVLLQNLGAVNETALKEIPLSDWAHIPSLREEAAARINDYIYEYSLR